MYGWVKVSPVCCGGHHAASPTCVLWGSSCSITHLLCAGVSSYMQHHPPAVCRGGHHAASPTCCVPWGSSYMQHHPPAVCRGGHHAASPTCCVPWGSSCSITHLLCAVGVIMQHHPPAVCCGGHHTASPTCCMRVGHHAASCHLCAGGVSPAAAAAAAAESDSSSRALLLHERTPHTSHCPYPPRVKKDLERYSPWTYTPESLHASPKPYTLKP